MIIDCHAHVFANWHGACGHPSVDIHLKYIQKNVTRPAAETFRLRDGAYVRLEPDERGIFESEEFPGLRLHMPSLLAGDLAGVLDELQSSRGQSGG